MAGLPLAGAIFGLCLGGPVVLLAGVKLGGVTAVGGSILGYTGATVIKEQREVRQHIDEYYKTDPDLFVRTPRQEATINRRRYSEQALSGSPRRYRAGSLPVRSTPCWKSQSKARFATSRSLNTSPTSQRRTRLVSSHSQEARRESSLLMAPPLNLRQQPFRRLGVLSQEEQQSVLVLLCRDHHEQQEESRQRNKLDGKRKMNTRTSSLPDVLEEDSISNKS